MNFDPAVISAVIAGIFALGAAWMTVSAKRKNPTAVLTSGFTKLVEQLEGRIISLEKENAERLQQGLVREQRIFTLERNLRETEQELALVKAQAQRCESESAALRVQLQRFLGEQS